MEPDRWKRVEELYHSALEKAPADRAAFLIRACAGDTELRREVEELLGHDDSREGLLDAPAWQQASEVLASAQLAAGTLLGPYRVIRRLGAGGMGSVYLAEDTRLRRRVAIKLLRARATTPNSYQRLQREAQLISSLSHPHICALYDIGSQDGIGFLVMEHVEGETLRSRLNKGALPLETAMRIGAQVADALAAAHSKGIVHRDLKPENIMLVPDPAAAGRTRAVVMDFGFAKVLRDEPGLAKLTRTGVTLGTPEFMSPEQVLGRPLDCRSDVYSLGVLAFEMFTGRVPFEGRRPQEVALARLKGAPPRLRTLRPELPVKLERVIERALAQDPADRFQSMEELRAGLASVITKPGVLARLFGGA
jgi:serine/threonine-protein kinase